jgi:hypothetical protein
MRYNTGYMEHFKYNPKAESPDVMGGLKEVEPTEGADQEFVWVPYDEWVFYKEWYDDADRNWYEEYLMSRGWLGRNRD